MNQIATRGGRAALPTFSTTFGLLVRAACEPGGSPPAIWRPEEREEAAAALPAYERACAPPASGDVIRHWLAKIVPAVRQPPDRDQFGAFVGLVSVTSGDLPTRVWSDESLAEALRTWKWWPAVADVDALLRPKAERLWRERDVLRLAANPPAAALPGPPKPPPEDRITPGQASEILKKWGYRSQAGAWTPPPSKPLVAAAASPRARLPMQVERDRQTVAGYRAQLRAKYAEDAASSDPVTAEVGRRALEAMDKAAARGAEQGVVE